MIIDCFPFFNELDLLEIRLNILDKVVDSSKGRDGWEDNTNGSADASLEFVLSISAEDNII